MILLIEAFVKSVRFLSCVLKPNDCTAKRTRQLPRFAAIWISIVYNLIVIWAAIPFPIPMFAKNMWLLAARLADLSWALEPLSPDDLERVGRGQSQSVVKAQRSYLHQAVDYFERGIAFTVSQSELPDGIHCFWHRSLSELESVSCNLISIKNVEGMRVFKSLELLKS